ARRHFPHRHPGARDRVLLPPRRQRLWAAPAAVPMRKKTKGPSFSAPRHLCHRLRLSPPTRRSALVEEHLRVVAPPLGAPLPVLADQDPEPDAGGAVAVVAGRTELQHALAQLVACDRATGQRYSDHSWRRGRWRRNHRRRSTTILRRDRDIGAVPARLIAA